MPFVHREIALNNGPPWGFRLYEDQNKGLIVHKIRQFSPADDARLKQGDHLLQINGKNTKHIKHHDAVNIIDSTYNTLVLLVGRYESTTSKHVMFLEHRGETQQNVFTSVQFNLNRPPPEPMTQPASPGLVPLPISRLLQEHEIPPRPDAALNRKKYANSEFFDTADVHYPTVEEKIERAKQLSESLTAPDNKQSKGALMFKKQLERIDKYVKEGPDPEPEIDLLHIVLPDGTIQEVNPPNIEPPPPPQHPPICFPGDLPISGRGSYQVPPPPPPPPPGAPKTLKEYLEKIKTYPKVQHDSIGPEKCFTIASALHEGYDRGAQIFMRNRQRSVKWTITDENVKHFNPPSPELAHHPVAKGVPSKLVTGNSNVTIIPQNRNQGQPNQVINSPNLNQNRNVQRAQPPSQQQQQQQITQNKIAKGNQIQNDTMTNSTKWRPVKFTVPSRA